MMFPLIWIHALSVSTFGSHWTVAIVALLIGLLAKTPRRSQARGRFSVARAASLKRTLAFSLLLAPLTATAGGLLSSGTTAVGGPTNFAVATIKPSPPGAHGNAFRVRGRRFESTNTSLSELIAFAYDLHVKQITAVPAWAETDKYDLTGQPVGEGQSTEKEWREMVRHLIGSKADQERRRSEWPSRNLDRTRCNHRNQCKHARPRGSDAAGSTRPASHRSDENYGKIRLHPQLDTRPISVRRSGRGNGTRDQ
jgi:hypothetical protein